MFKVDKEVCVLTKEQRDQLGLSHFPDGTFGVIPDTHAPRFIGPNWPHSAEVTAWQQTKEVTVTARKQNDLQCAQGGQIVQQGDRLFLFYHAELHPHGYKRFYSMLGLAVSKDHGASFEDLGIYGKSALPPDATTEAVEMCGGTVACREGYVYVYYLDYKSPRKRSLAVMRCALSDLLREDAVEHFRKWHCQSFSSPSIGGDFDPISEESMTWPCITYSTKTKRFYLVYSARTSLRIMESLDGLTWSKGRHLCSSRPAQEHFYPSIVGDTGEQNTFSREFTVYYTKSKYWPWGRWQDARIMRRRISFTE